MNLPSDFVERTKPLLKDEWNLFLSALEDEIPVSIRLNRRKTHYSDISLTDSVPWCESAFYLDKRPQFTFDPLFHAGRYYVQEASSMFVYQALKQHTKGDLRILDLCAAPGGKSTLIADTMCEDSLLVSNEVIRYRTHILSENITKWGNANTVVTNNDPSDFGRLQHYFDAILIDAPCSGEGMFRKDRGAVAEWSVDNVKLCADRQRRIVADVWDALKPGGLLLYSTCTYNMTENEDNVLWIQEALGAKSLSIDIEEEWGISSIIKGDYGTGCRFFPHKTKGEGFFLAALKKDEADIGSLRKEKERKKGEIDLPAEMKNYIISPEEFYFRPKNNHWLAIPQTLKEDINLLESKLNIISSGINIGEVKGKDFIPSQSLAMSCCLNRNAFICHEIDWQTAIKYLKKEILILSDLPRGYVLLTYRNTALGFVKNIGNRANNIYPQEWRIRSNNLPDNEVNVL